MIHEIYPKEYKVEYVNCTPEKNDIILFFDGENIFCRLENDEITYPCFYDFPVADDLDVKYIYLFSIDDERFFMPDIQSSKQIKSPDGYEWHPVSAFFRTANPRHLAFATVTAQELYKWYASNEYCGSCGVTMTHSGTERACVCPKCSLIVYPKISPCVIVGVTHENNLLVTRYRNRPFRQYALVAGFVEIDESFEDAVHREVFEETGVRVKNIKYYKSQPWGISSTILAGFYCELDGDPTINFDKVELDEALWLPREEIPPATLDIALTAEMIELFRTSGSHSQGNV